MQKFKTMTDVIALAEFAHRNQTDRAGLPYIEHPRRVMETVRAQGALPYVQMAAILHDVTEDTAFTPQILLDLGVPEAAVSLVTLLDRNLSLQTWVEIQRRRQLLIDSWQGLTEDEFKAAMGNWNVENGPLFETADEFYYANICKVAEARQVKLADIGDNLQPWRMSYLPAETQARLKAKYAKAHQMLGV